MVGIAVCDTFDRHRIPFSLTVTKAVRRTANAHKRDQGE